MAEATRVFFLPPLGETPYGDVTAVRASMWLPRPAMPTAPFRVLIVDDHAVVRAGLAALLRRLAGVEIVAEAGSGNEALELASTLRPDGVLLDLNLPDTSGFDVLAKLRRGQPAIRVVVVTMHSEPEYARRALALGAHAFLRKDVSPAEFERALDSVRRGGRYLPEATREDLQEAASTTPAGLSPRQTQILALVANGFTSTQIAGRLGISPRTVETHRRQIMERLAIRDVAGLVRYAIRKGLAEKVPVQEAR